MITVAIAALLLAAAPAPDAGEARSKAVAAWSTSNAKTIEALTGDTPALVAALRRTAASTLGPITDTEAADILLNAIDEMLGDGAFKRGLHLAEQAHAWALAKKLGPSVLYDTYTRTGSARYFLTDYAGAARDLGAAVEQVALITPRDDNAVANAGSNYAVVLDQAGRYRDAEEALEKAITLRRATTPFRAEGLAIALGSLGGVEKRMGNIARADAAYRESLTLMEANKLTDKRSYIRALHNYAVFLGDQARDEEASRLYRRVLEIMPAEQRAAPNSMPDHSSFAASLIAIGKLDEAEAALNDALAIAAKVTEPSPDLSSVYTNHAALAQARGDLATAEADYRKAIGADRRALGGDANREVIQDQVGLGTVLVRRGKTDEALATSKAAIDQIDVLSPGSMLRPLVHDTRALALRASGDVPGALAQARVASELMARRFEQESGREAGPLSPEEKPVPGRRIALLWEVDAPR